jgi:hypothetical protein
MAPRGPLPRPSIRKRRGSCRGTMETASARSPCPGASHQRRSPRRAGPPAGRRSIRARRAPGDFPCALPPLVAVSARFGRAGAASCCRSSVVEHSLGKGEVESSILSGSTSFPFEIRRIYRDRFRSRRGFLGSRPFSVPSIKRQDFPSRWRLRKTCGNGRDAAAPARGNPQH